ncbi:SLBB domain-containing protein [bacterium]|nr:SLBB domain-containing protein [bacterium]MBU1880410.1 SLBB domain-containing protein [bacterium]
MYKAFVFLVICVTLTAPLWAAEEPPISLPRYAEPGAQYFIGDENQLMMMVNVWGRVEKPGQYFVPSDTDLITLISVAGGPADKSRLDNVRLVRAGGAGSEVVKVNIKKFLKTGERSLIPELKPEDTIIVSGSMWFVISTVVTVVSQLAIVANVYYLATLASKK